MNNIIKTKVCGMKDFENITQIASLLPDYLGFIFWESSVRYFSGQLPSLPKSIEKVGVFVDSTLEYVIEKAAKYDLNLIQLHGRESPEFCQQLKKSGFKIIKVFAVADTFNFDALLPFESCCDFYLFDTKGRLPGGNGNVFNWKILDAYPSTKPLFLSGGIGLEELHLIKDLKIPIYAIDFNSKLEDCSTLKNYEATKKALQLTSEI